MLIPAPRVVFKGRPITAPQVRRLNDLFTLLTKGKAIPDALLSALLAEGISYAVSTHPPVE